MKRITIPNSALRTATTMVRDAARKAKWPASVVRQLNVIVDGTGNLVVDYPTSLNETVRDLEYGGESSPPSPVLRKITSAINYLVDGALQDAAMSGLLG